MNYWPWGIIMADGEKPWRWDSSFPCPTLDEAKQVIEKARKVFRMLIGVIDEDDGKALMPAWVGCYVDFAGQINGSVTATDSKRPALHKVRKCGYRPEELDEIRKFISHYLSNFNDYPPVELGSPMLQSGDIISRFTVDPLSVCGRILSVDGESVILEITSPDMNIKFVKLISQDSGETQIIKAYATAT